MATGALSPGDQLPTVRHVAVELAINPNTVLAGLSGDGDSRDSRHAARDGNIYRRQAGCACAGRAGAATGAVGRRVCLEGWGCGADGRRTDRGVASTFKRRSTEEVAVFQANVLRPNLLPGKADQWGGAAGVFALRGWRGGRDGADEVAGLCDRRRIGRGLFPAGDQSRGSVGEGRGAALRALSRIAGAGDLSHHSRWWIR